MCTDKELLQKWLTEFFDKEIVDIEGTISNERLCEIGWNCRPGSDELNPHTGNIANLEAYLAILKKLKEQGLFSLA